MNVICYVFIYIFEQFIAYLYFSKKYDAKKNNLTVFLIYSASFIIQFGVNFASIPFLNLLTFFICNAAVALLCFYQSPKQAIFNVLLLEGFMITTELITMYLVSFILGIKFTDYQNNSIIIISETISTKIIYFVCVYLISKFSTKRNSQKPIKNFSLFLFILPLTSVLILIFFGYLSIKYPLDRISYLMFSIISIILLIANATVFIINEKVTSTLILNTELQLEAQKTNINNDYYAELERQYDLSNILIHDIKRHLRIIGEFSKNKDFESIDSYIKSVYISSEIPTIKQFSNNKLINVIVSRYAHQCFNERINLETDIRNIDFSTVESGDLTALTDNLLENAFEAAKASEKKFINIGIDKVNEQFIIFKINNSCDFAPQKEGKHYKTSKTNNEIHGIGIKSINRIAKKYNGYSKFAYNENEKTFYSSVILKS